jgi:regulator of RNase E activity RraB
LANPILHDGHWESYAYNTEHGPVFVSFDVEAGKRPRDPFPYCARVIIPIQAPNHNGGPTGNEAEVLWAMEDALVALLQQHEAPCVLVARLTHAGERELVFQVGDWDAFRPPVGRWMHQHEDYETDVSEHDGWDFFENQIWPRPFDWMLIKDRQVMDALIKHGSNPEKEHALDYFFKGSPTDLQRLWEILQGRGHAKPGFEGTEGQMTTVRRMPLKKDLIWAESEAIYNACQNLEVEYDGWCAEVVK